MAKTTYHDRVKESCTFAGTGNVTLTGATTGCTTFPNGVCDYTLVSADETLWEVGTGTVTSGTLVRDTVLSNSSGTTALINFSGLGTAFNTISADRMNNREYLDALADSITATAVDVFVYNTADDDDDGAWVDDATWQSWYHEGSGTYRSSTQKFPKVAIIVAEEYKVTIYDGTVSGCPMWMVFNTGYSKMMALGGGYTLNGVTARNGLIYVSHADLAMGGLNIINFIEDIGVRYGTNNTVANTGTAVFKGFIVDRNTDAGFVLSSKYTGVIINIQVNDIAVTSKDMQNTIAVATNGGTSVIFPDGTVYNSNSATTVTEATFDEDKRLHLTLGNNSSNTYQVHENYFYANWWSPAFIYERIGNITDDPYVVLSGPSYEIAQMPDNRTVLGHTTTGTSRIAHNFNDRVNGMVCYQTADYVSGWMQGDVKGAWLSSTTAETVGVDEASELITNGTFATVADGEIGHDNGDGTLDGWQKYQASLSINGSNQLVITAVSAGANGSFAAYPLTTVIGQRYDVTVDFISGTTASYFRACNATTTPWAFVGNSGTLTVADTYSISFVATATTTYIMLGGTTIAGTEVHTYDNLTVKRSGNLLQNGDFPFNTTGWTANVGSFDPVSGTGRLTRNATGSRATTNAISTEVGKQYIVNYDYIKQTTTSDTVRITTSSDGSSTGQITIDTTRTASGNYSFTFTSTASTVYLALVGVTGSDTQYSDFDNISVRLADEDRSVNNNGLEVHGQITKSAVATGSELVAYSGFSADNYLEQPYNSDLDFGYGDFYVMGWAKGTDTGAKLFIRHDSSASPDRIAIDIAGSLYRFYVDTGAGLVSSTTSATLNIWTFVVGIRKNGILTLYINGVAEGTGINASDLTNTSAIVHIGEHPDLTDPFTGSLALWRIGKGAPTAEQISEIYESERRLFQAGAKCTLQGTSSDVKALAYDEHTGLLTVVSADKITRFDGLRVESSDTDTKTSISVNNGIEVTG